MKNIKTMISTPKSILDRDDQWLPPGNYFFLVKKLKNKYVMGTVSHEEGFTSNFEFKITDFIEMMAARQSQLARKAGLTHEKIPHYPTPPTSPNRKYPNNYVQKILEEEDKNQKCAICFEEVYKKRDYDFCKRALTCEHAYHRRCIIPWIRISDTCPICRKKKRTRRELEEKEIHRELEEDEILRPREVRRTSELLIRTIRERMSGRDVPSNYIIQATTRI